MPSTCGHAHYRVQALGRCLADARHCAPQHHRILVSRDHGATWQPLDAADLDAGELSRDFWGGGGHPGRAGAVLSQLPSGANPEPWT